MGGEEGGIGVVVLNSTQIFSFTQEAFRAQAHQPLNRTELGLPAEACPNELF